jgi:hypothetical protein
VSPKLKSTVVDESDVYYLQQVRKVLGTISKGESKGLLLEKCMHIRIGKTYHMNRHIPEYHSSTHPSYREQQTLVWVENLA